MSCMENKNICTCSLCRKGDYNSADYYVDMSFLKKERPVGVTGLLRVKNDESFLPTCIDSCIDALDELIICYQECSDNTPEIIYRKQQQYPDKIKVYFYAPPVFCHDLSDEERAFAFSLPDDSVHKLCNYYNYTLSKATYRYAMKIDSDQIYFGEKLKKYCDAYRREEPVKILFGDFLIKNYAKIHKRISVKIPCLFYLDLFSVIPFLSRLIVDKYEDYQIKEIINNKYALSMSGINIGYKHGKWGVYVIDGRPFNGVTDHLIFQITEETYYITLTGRDKPIEVMKYNKKMLIGGWFWYHLLGMRSRMDQYPKEWVATLAQLKPRNIYIHWPTFMRAHWLFFWVYRTDSPNISKIL